MDILSMQNVSLSFGSTRALDGLSFAVKEGEIFGFLGPSGAGKTTTIKLLTRQLRPGAGEIAVFGAPIARLDSAAYEQIGILSDNSGVYERMSVYENTKLFADLRGLPASRIGEVLERVGPGRRGQARGKKTLQGYAPEADLSHGRAAPAPGRLSLDEPTAALDPATTAAIHRLLREMNDGGTTIFLTTHNMEEADRLCARVAFLNEGRIAETGVPARLKLKYAKDRVRVLLEDGEALECARNPEAMGALLAGLSGRGIASVHSEEPDLEEIFLQVTGRKIGMKKHLRVLRTLFVKDVVDLFRNPNVLLMLALPLIFIVIYQFVDLGMSPAYLLMLGVMMNLCLTPLSVLGMIDRRGKGNERHAHADAVQCDGRGVSGRENAGGAGRHSAGGHGVVFSDGLRPGAASRYSCWCARQAA